MKPRKPRCGHCKFWSDWRRRMPPATEFAGWCQLHAPTMGADGRAAWPVTDSYECCGEFQDKRRPRQAAKADGDAD